MASEGANVKFYEWNYSAGEVTEYRRVGECAQCGECCRALVRYSFIKPPRRKNPRNGGPATSGEDIWQEVNHGRWSYFFGITEIELGADSCGGLTGGDLCEEHATKDHICADWPFSPRCIGLFPSCGYSFEEISQWRSKDCERPHRRPRAQK